MSEKEIEILEYLEDSFCGARAMDDLSAMVRISRAIAAFKSDPEDAPEAVFNGKFLEHYYMSII